jgi:hypothetical protein
MASSDSGGATPASLSALALTMIMKRMMDVLLSSARRSRPPLFDRRCRRSG